MSPLIKKTLFRIKKLKRPLKSDGEKKVTDIARGLRRGLLGATIAILIIGVVYSGKLSIRTVLNDGDIALEDIYAPFDFKYQAGIDEGKTKENQELAAQGVSDVYVISPAVFERAEGHAKAFFGQLVSIRKSGQEISAADIVRMSEALNLSIDSNEIKALLAYPDINLLNDEAILLLKESYLYPIISEKAKKAVLSKIIEPIMLKSKIDNKEVRKILAKLVYGWISPNLVFDPNETEAAKKEAISAVMPVYTMMERAKGEIIIRKGQRATKDHIAQIDTIKSASGSEDIFSRAGGMALLICLLAFLFVIYLKDFEPKVFSQDKLLALIGLLILFSAISVRIIVSSPFSTYLIPVAAVAMLLTLLVNGNVAAIVVVAVSVIAAMVAGIRFNILLVSMVGGISAICTVNNARRRNQILKAGLYVGILNFITICGIGILSGFEVQVFLREGLWGAVNGIVSAGITMIFLPVLESLFKITTNIKLLELADLNHPLLKSMVTKATGTYHHSIVVGNLAEAAAEAIGANSLLARIGSYYHDIGKIEKAEYFAENEQTSSDMHDKLAPSMSSLIITNHVKDGVELAEKYKLGNAIKDIIEQHHGTGLVTYFFHQAIEKTQAKKLISDESFRYLGPKPQTKESAIVMLADSIEAASRVLQNPTPQKLKELARKIINDKFIDRQLSECELTLKDINNIADAFVKILTGIYHSRVEYPNITASKYGNNNSKQPKKDTA